MELPPRSERAAKNNIPQSAKDAGRKKRKNSRQRRLWRAGFGVEGGAAAGRGEGFAVGAEFGLLEEVAGGVEREMAVGELDAAAGVAGVALLGYSIYFDHKRRSAPDYKQKIRESRFL
jgi:hypothetical protein